MASPELDWAFPKVDPMIEPFGGRVMVQLRRVKKTSAGGIIIVDEARSAERDKTQVARVCSIGPLAYRNKQTMEFYPEGVWADVGDFVRVPKYGGDRFEVFIANEEEPVIFAMFNDLELIGKVKGDPLVSGHDYLNR